MLKIDLSSMRYELNELSKYFSEMALKGYRLISYRNDIGCFVEAEKRKCNMIAILKKDKKAFQLKYSNAEYCCCDKWKGIYIYAIAEDSNYFTEYSKKDINKSLFINYIIDNLYVFLYFILFGLLYFLVLPKITIETRNVGFWFVFKPLTEAVIILFSLFILIVKIVNLFCLFSVGNKKKRYYGLIKAALCIIFIASAISGSFFYFQKNVQFYTQPQSMSDEAKILLAPINLDYKTEQFRGYKTTEFMYFKMQQICDLDNQFYIYEAECIKTSKETLREKARKEFEATVFGDSKDVVYTEKDNMQIKIRNEATGVITSLVKSDDVIFYIKMNYPDDEAETFHTDTIVTICKEFLVGLNEPDNI